LCSVIDAVAGPGPVTVRPRPCLTAPLLLRRSTRRARRVQQNRRRRTRDQL